MNLNDLIAGSEYTPDPLFSLEFRADWLDSHGVAFQVDGQDLVHITDIDSETGIATVTVFSSSHPDATVLFTGEINVLERKQPEAEPCEWFVNNGTVPAWCCNTHMYDGTGDFPATGEHPDECPFADAEEEGDG